MRHQTNTLLLLLLPLLFSGCTSPGQRPIELPLFVSGTSNDVVDTGGGAQLTLQRADLAFGPLYLCAGVTAGELCETARLEWLDTAVVDMLADNRVQVGTLRGVTGAVRSWMFDYGISSQLTRNEPYVLEAAEQLGGTSFVGEGVARSGNKALPFVVRVAIAQNNETELGVPVVRKSATQDFAYEVTEDASGLLLRFDVSEVMNQLNLTPFFAEQDCAPDGPAVVCRGNTATECTAEGVPQASQDCEASAQTCAAGIGCIERLEIAENSEPYREVRNALLLTGRPTFVWDDPLRRN